MRVPSQAPALARNQRSRLVRRYGRRPAGGEGVRPSQYDGGDEGEGGEDGAEDGGGETGDEMGDEGDASVEAE